MFGKKKEKENTKELEIEAEESLPEKGEKRVYEVGYLVAPIVAEEELGEHISFVKDVVEDNGGVIISEEWPKRERLAYTMSHKVEGKRAGFKEGYFGWIKFELTPASLENIEHRLRGHNEIVRFLLIQTVREDTRRKSEPVATAKERSKKRLKSKKKEREQISSEELDEAIDELVVE